MVNKNLVKFIKEAEKRGYSDVKIKQLLLKNKWLPKEIKDASDSIRSKKAVKKKTVKRKPARKTRKKTIQKTKMKLIKRKPSKKRIIKKKKEIQETDEILKEAWSNITSEIISLNKHSFVDEAVFFLLERMYFVFNIQ